MVNDLTQEQIKSNWISLANNPLLPEEYRKEVLRGALITMKLEIPEQLKPTPNSAEQEFDSETTTRSM